MRIGITVGDPAGIGPEIVAAAVARLGADGLRVYGDIRAAEAAGGLDAAVERVNTASTVARPGEPDPTTAPGTVEAIRRAASDCLSGAIDAMVTAPISKEILAKGGFDYPGHTELLEECAGRGNAVMLLVGGQLRVALATIHCALREVPDRLTRDGIEAVLRVMDTDLRGRFGLVEPSIAVCGLNPHAGEGGRFGDEEERVIRPAVQAARASGVAAQGPFSGDSLFARAVKGEFDAVLGMYHDQALAPLKLHAFGHAVNVTLGLPLIRTSVDHGTAFDIAGRGEADATSLIEAITLAREIASRSAGSAGSSDSSGQPGGLGEQGGGH